MNFKKLKLATGIIGFAVIVTTLFFAFFTLPYASKHAPEGGSWTLFGMALYFNAVIILLCVLAFMQLIYSLYYVFAKPRVRSFFVVGCVFSFFDILNMTLVICVAVSVTHAVGGWLFPFIAAIVLLPVVANIVLRILCACKFKPEEREQVIVVAVPDKQQDDSDKQAEKKDNEEEDIFREDENG